MPGRPSCVGLSFGGLLACVLAAYHPERVKAAILAGTAAIIGSAHKHMSQQHFMARQECPDGKPMGWNKYNRAHWLADYPDFAEHFIRNIFTEPHSTRQIEEGIAWAGDTDGPVLVKTVEARTIVPPFDVTESMYRKIRCPVLAIHGDNDQIQPHARGKLVAELTGAEFVTIADGGHNPLGRVPAKCNALINDFLDRRLGLAAPKAPVRRAPREKKVLYLSSPIGLGHGRRDIAIARELRRLHPRLHVDWLAQDPVTRLLEKSGERIHPLSARLASESRHIEEEAGEHDLNAFQAIRRMDELLIANFMIFQDAVDAGGYDLVIADEAWDIDHYWHEHPELKKAALAWFTDFVGFVPMPSGGEHEAFLAADYNAEMIEHVERHPGVRDRAIFVGNPEDIVPLQLRQGSARDARLDSQALRLLGLRAGPASASIRPARGAAAKPGLSARREGLHRHRGRLGRRHPSDQAHPAGLAAGPRAAARAAHDAGRRPTHRPARRWPRRPASRCRAFVPDLDRHLAACDLAVVQGGLTTCMELAAAGTPFLYFPLKNHFEQNFHVAHRLDRYARRPAPGIRDLDAGDDR